MKTHTTKSALFALLLVGSLSLSHINAYADTNDASKTLPVEPWHTHSYELQPITKTSQTEAESNTPGLKLGNKNKIELYGTVEIGYSNWSHKN